MAPQCCSEVPTAPASALGCVTSIASPKDGAWRRVGREARKTTHTLEATMLILLLFLSYEFSLCKSGPERQKVYQGLNRLKTKAVQFWSELKQDVVD